MQTVIIEYRDNTHSMTYNPEPPKQSIWIREWKYIEITNEELREIKEASVERVEKILSELYER